MFCLQVETTQVKSFCGDNPHLPKPIGNIMSYFYFKSPDFTLCGNIKVQIVHISTETLIPFSPNNLILQQVEIRVNDGDIITLQTDVESMTIPSFDYICGKDWKITIDVTNEIDILCSLP